MGSGRHVIRVGRAESGVSSSIRRAGRIMGIFLTIVAAIIVLAVGLLAIWSPGKTRPVVDAKGNLLPNSIAEKIHVSINGLEQGMFVRSADAAHPVLLNIHGGPGMPTYFLDRQYPAGLEADFTIVWWDQRGAGLSFNSSIPAETMTVQQMVADTLAVTDYLRTRFGQDKIYLMGHSWGSFIGIQAAAQAPERYHAYIGVGQITRQLESERLAYDYMLSAFRDTADTSMLRKLQDAPFAMTVPMPEPYMKLRDAAMHRLGIGTMRHMRSVISGVFLAVWLDPEYTLTEKLNIWRGRWSVHALKLWDEVLRTDVTVNFPKLDIPVYFLHGRYDYTVSRELAKAYLQQLQAPLKGFYTYDDSAHSPIFEDPKRTRMILMNDVLAGAVKLADAE